jgi:hypothetical protein
MKLRIGDKVRFLNETGEGVITRFKDKDNVYVEIGEGFEIPFPVKQLVPIHTELILNPDADNLDINPESISSEAIFLVLEPDHDMPLLVSDFHIYLFNSSSYQMMFTYSIKDGAYYQTLKHGEVGPLQKVFLKTVKLNFFKEFNYHKLECLLFKNQHYKSQIPIAEVVYIDSKTLDGTALIKHDQFKNRIYTYLLKDEFLNSESIEQSLTEDDMNRVRSIKERQPVTNQSKSHKHYLRNLEKEVDLHIEELVDNPSLLNNHDMLNIQIARFEKELDQAIEKGLRQIVFIHGVGNGRLKQEIQKRLKHRTELSYQDASYKLYGFGATQVDLH